MTVFNLGSINIDMALRVPHLPAAGETLSAESLNTGLGGKGANQSVAVARSGHDVIHIGMVGPDDGMARARLVEFGVDVRHVGLADGDTGRAFVMVGIADAENSIIILPGANQMQSPGCIQAALSEAQPGDTLLIQNETSMQDHAAKQARSAGVRVIYSAAPFSMPAVRAVLPYVSVLLLNKVEAAQLCEAMECRVDALPVAHVVVTRGAEGAVLYDTTAETQTPYPTLKVDPVDTTAAGDTFAGYLASGLDQGMSWDDNMRRSLAAAALCTTKKGTAEAIPDLSEVLRAMSGADG